MKILQRGWKELGKRKYLVYPISFWCEFSGNRPHVLLSLTRVDSDRAESSMTYSLEPRDVSTAGFKLAVGLDDDSISSLQVSWLAISSSVSQGVNGDWQFGPVTSAS